jgi:hypothetical protein
MRRLKLLKEEGKSGDSFDAAIRSAKSMHAGGKIKGRWEFTCRDKNGKVKWRDFIENDVVNVGLDDLLDKYFKGSAYTALHYVGLTDGTPTPAAGDTMASHAGWVEVQAYDEAVRQTFTPGAVSGQSVDNSASKATFTIDTNSTTIGGAFLTTDNTKGGSTGTLYAVGAFSAGDKLLDDNDVLEVTATFTAADDGV